MRYPSRRLVTLALLALDGLLSGCGAAQMHPATDPQRVALEAALGNRYVVAGQRSAVVARIHIAATPADPALRPPVNLALVVDTSGSMEGTAIDNARTASLSLVDSLGPSDRLSVVVFHAQAEVLVPSTTLEGDRRAEVRRRIAAMRAQGTTAMAEGLQMGLSQLATHFDPGGINRVVLLSDGVPNVPQGIEAMAAAAGARGITITSLGLGPDYDETLMGAIAQRSGGRFHYLADSSQVASVFHDELVRLRRVVARNAMAVLTPGPDVTIEAVVGQETARNGQTVTVPVGDLSDGEARDLIVRLSAPAHRAGAPVEILDATLAFDDAAAGAGHLERHAFLGAHASADAAQRAEGRNEDVERTAAQITLAAGTVAAIREARGGDVAAAQASLDRVIEEARQSPQSSALAGRAASVMGLRRALPSVRPASTVPPAPVQPSNVDYAPSTVVREAHDAAMQTLQGS